MAQYFINKIPAMYSLKYDDSTGYLKIVNINGNNADLTLPQIITLNGAVSSLQSDMVDLQSDYASLETNFNSFKTVTQTNFNNINNNISNMSNSISSIKTMQNSINAFGQRINSIQQNIIYNFNVQEQNITTLLFTKEQIGTETEYQFDIIDSNGYNITTDTRLSRRWINGSYQIKMMGGWEIGEYKLKSAQGIKGDSYQSTNIIDTQSTSVQLNALGGHSYTYTQPLTSLVLSSVENSQKDTVIKFTLASNGTVIFPESLDLLGTIYFSPSYSYVIFIRDNMMSASVYTPGV